MTRSLLQKVGRRVRGCSPKSSQRSVFGRGGRGAGEGGASALFPRYEICRRDRAVTKSEGDLRPHMTQPILGYIRVVLRSHTFRMQDGRCLSHRMRLWTNRRRQRTPEIWELHAWSTFGVLQTPSRKSLLEVLSGCCRGWNAEHPYFASPRGGAYLNALAGQSATPVERSLEFSLVRKWSSLANELCWPPPISDLATRSAMSGAELPWKRHLPDLPTSSMDSASWDVGCDGLWHQRQTRKMMLVSLSTGSSDWRSFAANNQNEMART